MITALLIYLFTVVTALVEFAWVLLAVSTGLYVMNWAIASKEIDNEVIENCEKKRETLLSIIIGCVIFCCLVPTNKDIKYILGGTIAVEGASLFMNAEGADKIPDNIVAVVNEFLEETKGESNENSSNP